MLIILKGSSIFLSFPAEVLVEFNFWLFILKGSALFFFKFCVELLSSIIPNKFVFFFDISEVCLSSSSLKIFFVISAPLVLFVLTSEILFFTGIITVSFTFFFCLHFHLLKLGYQLYI